MLWDTKERGGGLIFPRETPTQEIKIVYFRLQQGGNLQFTANHFYCGDNCMCPVCGEIHSANKCCAWLKTPVERYFTSNQNDLGAKFNYSYAQGKIVYYLKCGLWVQQPVCSRAVDRSTDVH